MSNQPTESYLRGIAARTSVNNAVSGTGRAIKSFACFFGHTVQGFVAHQPSREELLANERASRALKRQQMKARKSKK